MRKRIALIAVLACGVVALTPAAAGASGPLCFEHTAGALHIQIGYCP